MIEQHTGCEKVKRRTDRESVSDPDAIEFLATGIGGMRRVGEGQVEPIHITNAFIVTTASPHPSSPFFSYHTAIIATSLTQSSVSSPPSRVVGLNPVPVLYPNSSSPLLQVLPTLFLPSLLCS